MVTEAVGHAIVMLRGDNMHRPYIAERPGATKAVLMIHGICGSPRRFDWLVPAYAYFGKKDALVSTRSMKDFSNVSYVNVRMFETAGHCWYSPEDQKIVLDDLRQWMNRIEYDK